MTLAEIDRTVASMLGWSWDEKTVCSPHGSRWARLTDGGRLVPFTEIIPTYTMNMSDAWEIIEKVKTLRFSFRYRFEKNLQEVVSLRMSGEFIIRDYAIWMEPIDICNAFIQAFKNQDLNSLASTKAT